MQSRAVAEITEEFVELELPVAPNVPPRLFAQLKQLDGEFVQEAVRPVQKERAAASGGLLQVPNEKTAADPAVNKSAESDART